jgi:hypothetical protein
MKILVATWQTGTKFGTKFVLDFYKVIAKLNCRDTHSKHGVKATGNPKNPCQSPHYYFIMDKL